MRFTKELENRRFPMCKTGFGSCNALAMDRISSLLRPVAVLLAFSLLFATSLGVAADPALGTAEAPLERAVLAGNDVSSMYQANFGLFDRGILGRAPASVQATLKNNVYEKLNLSPGSTACYKIEKQMIQKQGDGSKNEEVGSDNAQSGGLDVDNLAKLYVTATTCLHPDFTNRDGSPMEAPQLALIISSSTENPCPASSEGIPEKNIITFEQGAANFTSNETSKDVFITVLAPKVASDVKYANVYAFEIAASTDTFFHQTNITSGPELLWIDSDSSSALLITKNLTTSQNSTEKILKEGPPFQLFVGNDNDHGMSMKGVERSVCGMQTYAQISANRNNTGKLYTLVKTGMTTRGPGDFPKQQFFFQSLNSSSKYTGVLVRNSNVTSLSKRDDDGTINGLAGGGGTVYQAVKFETLPDTNCRVVTDLDFCEDIQYAVPGNNKKYPNMTALAKKYDDYARQMYTNFEKVMMQIPCETDELSRYSLARNCKDCREAYKRWLCTVSIPRCEDFSSPNKKTVVRNVNQSYPNGTKLYEEGKIPPEVRSYNTISRNIFIDKEIQPGPYREILPCDDICFAVVQSCPAAIGFACPARGSAGYSWSYAERKDEGSSPSCNYPGEARTYVSSGRKSISGSREHILAAVMAMLLWISAQH